MSNNNDNDPVADDKTEIVSIAYPEVPELEVCHILGKGGSGTVYKGRQPFLKRDVAIKVLNVTNGVIDDEFVERFHREAQILADLIHPHIVSCFQAGVTVGSNEFPQSPFLAMEFIDGPSLQTWIHQQGKVAQPVALSIIEKIAEALAYAHKKSIIHRDIKAENILLKPDEHYGDDEQEFNYIPKLADLGIARSTQANQDNNLTVVGTMIGTPSSMAPEQFNEPDNIDFKADIYGLGCVLFHMVTGKKPFEGNNLTEMVIQKNSHDALDPADINPQLDKKVIRLIQSMMAVNKADRPGSYADLIAQCQELSRQLGQQQGKKDSNGQHKANKSRLLYMLPVAGVLLFAISYFLYPSIYSTEEQSAPVMLSDQQTESIVKPSEVTQAQVIVTEVIEPEVIEQEVVEQEIVEPEVVEQEVATPEVIEGSSEATVAELTELFEAPAETLRDIEQPADSPNDDISIKTEATAPETTVPEIVETEIIKPEKNFLRIQYLDKDGVFLAPGESFSLKISSQQDAYLYCYFENQNSEVIRFFPNRFVDNAFVSQGKPLILPAENEFTLSASLDGVGERIACFSSVTNILNMLPEKVIGIDFESLPVTSLEQIKEVFYGDEKMQISDAFFNIRVL